LGTRVEEHQPCQHGKAVDKQAGREFGGALGGKKPGKTSLNGDAKTGRLEEYSYKTKG
jgi:hypothetical protein